MVDAVWTNIDPEPLIDDVAINVDPFQADQIGSEGSEGSYSQRSLFTDELRVAKCHGYDVLYPCKNIGRLGRPKM